MDQTGKSSVTPILPSAADAEAARELAENLTQRLRSGSVIRLAVDGKTANTVLPKFAAELMLDLLNELATGNAVIIKAAHSELTTQEAADLLCVSRPTLIQFLDAGKIPFRKIGTHRRIPLANVLAFKTEQYAGRKSALDEMSRLQQELGLE